jgi:hypothetical protein
MVKTQVWLTIREGGADTERLEEVTDRLCDELLELDVEDVSGVREGEAPLGSRAVDLAAVGALLVSMKDSIQLLGHLVAAVRSWLTRSSAERTVELTIGDKTLRITNASSDQQDRLIDEFIQAIDWDRTV